MERSGPCPRIGIRSIGMDKGVHWEVCANDPEASVLVYDNSSHVVDKRLYMTVSPRRDQGRCEQGNVNA